MWRSKRFSKYGMKQITLCQIDFSVIAATEHCQQSKLVVNTSPWGWTDHLATARAGLKHLKHQFLPNISQQLTVVHCSRTQFTLEWAKRSNIMKPILFLCKITTCPISINQLWGIKDNVLGLLYSLINVRGNGTANRVNCLEKSLS